MYRRVRPEVQHNVRFHWSARRQCKARCHGTMVRCLDTVMRQVVSPISWHFPTALKPIPVSNLWYHTVLINTHWCCSNSLVCTWIPTSDAHRVTPAHTCIGIVFSMKVILSMSEWVSESESWVFYAVSTVRVIFTVKTRSDIFSLRQEQVWTFSVLGDWIYEMRCQFVAVGLNAHFIVLPHWDNMS